MTIQQMRQAMSAKYETLTRMKAEVESSGRKPTQAERDQATALLDEIADLDIAIRTEETGEYLHSSQRKPTRPDLGNPSPTGFSSSTPGKHFRSFADQLLAIRNAAQSGNPIDNRLYQVRAALGLSESVPSDSGFLLEPTFSREIITNAFSNGQIARLCREFPLGVNSNSVKINAIAESDRTSTRWGGILAYWLAEAGTKTASAPKFRQMELILKKLIMLVYATDELLQDVTLLDQILRQGFTEELALRLDDAILRGSGAGQPLGILNSAALISVARAGAGAISSIDIFNMFSRLLPGSYKNAVWVVSQTILPSLYGLTVTVGTAGGSAVFLPGGSIAGQPFSTLLGRPVIVSECASALGTVGDIVLGDFSQYAIITKGNKVDLSIHCQFITDQSLYRSVARLDGQPLLASPVTPYKGGSTVSAFIALAT